MNAPYLGKSTINWCDACNVPLLETCGSCGSAGRIIQLTPPGDIRPAFEGDTALIKRLASGFGPVDIKSQIYLNRIGAADRSDEIYVDGRCVGILAFDPASLKFRLQPRPEMAHYIDIKRKFVQLSPDAESFILDGKSVLVPGVVSADPSICKEEYVFILVDKKPIATAIAKMAGPEMVSTEHGVAAKTKHIATAFNVPSTLSTLDNAVKANASALSALESKAVGLMRSVAKKHNLPLTVSFSGGKDSLVTLLLAKQAFEKFSTFFIDTGIEFPETVEYVKQVGKWQPIITESAGDAFWSALDTFGPPGRDYRHCCKVCKLGPATQLITKNFPDGCLTFGGERRYESELRARRGYEGQNPWVPNQLSCYPIKDWNALAVWLYILWKGKPFNPLYREGYERIGCYPCPASNLAEFELLKEAHPNLHKKLFSRIEKWGREHFSPDYVNHGLWRWKTLPESQLQLAHSLGISTKAKIVAAPLELKIEKGVSPCKAGGFSVEGTLGAVDLVKLAKVARLLGEPRYSEELGLLKISAPGNEVNVYATGNFRIVGDNPGPLPERLFSVALKAMTCAKCGICVSLCPAKAIKLDGGLEVSPACTRCGACFGRCPALRYNQRH